MPLCLVHIVIYTSSSYSFLFLSCIPLYGCTAVCLSSLWKIFELCTILDNCDWKFFKNSHAGICMDLSAFFLDIYIYITGNARSYGIYELYYTQTETATLFSKQAIPFCILVRGVWEIQSLELERSIGIFPWYYQILLLFYFLSF